MASALNRRAFLALPIVGMTKPALGARTGVHVTGRLVEDAPDLQAGYFALCGAHACTAKDAIAISVHPDNPLLLEPLRALVGKEVQVSIFQP